MSSNGRISTPWFHYWQRFRYRMLPVLSFVVCVVVTVWLWERQGRFPNLVGEVEAVRVDVAARADGVLAALPEGPLARFDVVRANQVVARLDDQLIQTQLETMQRELARLGQELKATAEKTTLSESDRQHTYLQEVTRFQSEVEQRRLDVLSRKTAIEVDRLALQRLNVHLEYLERSFEKNVVPVLELTEARMQRDELSKRIEENRAALTVAEAQQAEAEGRLKQFPGLEKAKVEDLLAPIEAAITVQKSRIRELQIQIEALEIRSPIAGMIYEILRWPGQNVRAGDPIVTVADNAGGYIVSYVRQEIGRASCRERV